ncbi:MAG: response regulator transcription factor [gamma proteobacterium symbiont of Taylorina sp.]|nr:response regulator transcription factor [gamma proteobacterium symbiont of Taylorina sp.]
MKILVADDHQLFIDGIHHILNKLDSNVVITETVCADQAILVLESGQEFDLILIDLCMPGMDGMSILQRMHERGVWLPLVVVSSVENIYTIKSSLDAGALGFIPKSHSSQQMIAALNAILEGEIYIPPEIEKQIDNLETRRPLEETINNNSLKNSGITRRQFDVLKLLAKGYSNKQIATTLFLTEHTIKSHIRALFSALDASNRTECVQNALHQEIIKN